MFSIRLGRRDDLEADILREAAYAARSALANADIDDPTKAAIAVVDAYRAAQERLRQPIADAKR